MKDRKWTVIDMFAPCAVPNWEEVEFFGLPNAQGLCMKVHSAVIISSGKQLDDLSQYVFQESDKIDIYHIRNGYAS